MNDEQAKRLREPFPSTAIGKLPRKTKEGGTIYLDFVGHAHVTDRLLHVDPEWTWEPMAVDEAGNPLPVSGLGEANEPIGLWINLTVAGVTRPGFGSGKTAKEAISDAIRNASMRFGVALDLWAKEPMESSAEPEAPEKPKRSRARVGSRSAPEEGRVEMTVSVPLTWPALLEAFNATFYAHPWHEWWIEAIQHVHGLRIESQSAFSETLALLRKEKGKDAVDEAWKNAVAMYEQMPRSDLGPSRDEVRKVIMDTFGVLCQGPKVSMGPDEAAFFPTFEMYARGDQRPAAAQGSGEESGVVAPSTAGTDTPKQSVPSSPDDSDAAPTAGASGGGDREPARVVSPPEPSPPTEDDEGGHA